MPNSDSYQIPQHITYMYMTGRPVILSCGTCTEKALKFVDNQLEEVMQNK